MKRYRLFLLTICFLVLILVIIYGHTWHLFPAYLAFCIASVILLLKKHNRRKILTIIICVFLLTITGISLYLLPFISLPKPTGDYKVGVTYRTVNTGREETFTEDSVDTRTIYLKIWYPAKEGKTKAVYFNGGKKAIVAANVSVGFPYPFMLYQLEKIKTNAFSDATIADGTFPLITFSHGYSGTFIQNTSLAEHLASKGFIVVSIGHSYQTSFAATSENEIITFEKIVPNDSPNDTIPKEASEYTGIIQALNNISDQKMLDEFLMLAVNVSKTAKNHVIIWASDISSAIDLMSRENGMPGSMFYNKINPEKIGSVGMSFGGAAAVQATLSDKRIKAAANMDGFQFGTLINDTTNASLLFLEALRSPQGFSEYNLFFQKSTKQVSCLLFEGAEHRNFIDLGVTPILKYFKVTGKVNGNYVLERINTILPDFFNTTLSNSSFNSEKYLEEGKIVAPNR